MVILLHCDIPHTTHKEKANMDQDLNLEVVAILKKKQNLKPVTKNSA